LGVAQRPLIKGVFFCSSDMDVTGDEAKISQQVDRRRTILNPREETMKIDPQTIEQLNAINKKYIDAANNHDAVARAALYTEDAVFVTHSGPLYGRQAIEKFYADEFKAWHDKNFHRTIDPNSYRIIGTGRQCSVKWRMEFHCPSRGRRTFPNQGLLVSDSYS
jgi:uncharacterized protein (TIGR02246 family)